MSDLIILKVQDYLSGLYRGRGNDIPFQSTAQFADVSVKALRRQLSPDKEREFRIRMSNLGRPGCILQAEQLGLPREPAKYSDRFRNIYGDLVEAAAVAVMEQAGINIISKQEGVKLIIAEQTIEGTYDLVIAEPDKKLYDVKSSSGYLFRNAYKDKTLKNLWDEGDHFGYVTQIYLYSQALQIPVGGLIVINKENGEWCIVSPPTNDKELRLAALRRATNNTVRIVNKEPFRKDFEPIEEWFRRKPTGNMVLPHACVFCDYKKHCFPQAIELPQIVSKGSSPKKVWYTKIDKKYEKETNDGE